MGIIEQRISLNGARLDGFPGLVAKAYLYACRDDDGQNENRYAPLYFWREGCEALTSTPCQRLTSQALIPVVTGSVVRSECGGIVQRFSVIKRASARSGMWPPRICSSSIGNVAAFYSQGKNGFNLYAQVSGEKSADLYQ